MMKNFKHFTKRTLALLLALVMCVGLLQLTAFAEDTESCQHQWRYQSHDSTNHILVCALCQQTKTESHSFDEWVHIKDATYEESGLETRSCSGCRYEEQKILPSGKDEEEGWVPGGSFGTGGTIPATEYTLEYTWGRSNSPSTFKPKDITLPEKQSYTANTEVSVFTELAVGTIYWREGRWNGTLEELFAHIDDLFYESYRDPNKENMSAVEHLNLRMSARIFEGWSTKYPANYSDMVGSSITMDKSYTLIANWHSLTSAEVGAIPTPTVYTVKWVSGYGNNEVLSTTTGTKDSEGNLVYSPYSGTTPTRTDGYTFTAWGTPEVNEETKTCTITAQWTEKHVHSYTQTKAPTCEEKGEETCSCGDKREIDALGHIEGNWVDGDTKDAVHTDGCETTQHKEICTRCGAVLDTKDHTYGDWTVTKEPNCTDTGVKEHTCTVCGHKKAEPISKLNHDWQIKDEGDAGHSWVCKNDPEHTKPVEPHNYPDEWTVTKQPTDTEPGEKEKVCEDCGHKHTEEIPATKPDDPKPEKVNVTYQDPDGEEIGKDTPDKGTEYEVKGLPDGTTPPEGKEFDKWQGSDGNEYKPGDKITPDGDLTLTVVWKDKPEEKPEEPETPVPVVPEIVVTPKPSEDPAPSEDPGEEIIDPSEPPLGELPTEPSEAPEPSEPAETDPAESEDLSEEIIDPSEPPLGELPEDLAKPGEPADTDQPGDSFAPGEEPGEDISDGQPPMGNVPEEPGEDISDNRPPMSDAPVSDVPQTGEASNVIWLAATLLAGAGLVVVNTGKRKEERK